ncbi:MAG TPA: MG2 domain-containing protein, partial [Nannocystis sp.]
LHETAIDLSPALRDGLGHAIVVVEPTVAPAEPWQRQRVLTWVQATRIGLDAFVDRDKLVAYTSDLATGAPLDGVQLSLVPSGVRVVSDRDGLATLKLPPRGNRALLAVRGADQALLPEQTYGYFERALDTQGWRPRTPADNLLWHVFDDRGIYRPGETVRIKGWLRVRSRGPRKGLSLPGERAREIRYTLRDSQGNTLLTGVRALNALGGFDLALELPKTPQLGWATLALEVSAGSMKKREFAHRFRIEEFRRPEYEVTTRADEGPHVVGGHAALTVAAHYYSGGPLIGAEVRWKVSASPAHFVPPGRDEYTFGRFRPWWERSWDLYKETASRPREGKTFTGRTDAAGEHHVRADFLRVTPVAPSSVRAEATVIDVNRQAWTSATQVLVHPASVYVGLKSERLFVQRGEPLRVEAIAVDLDGKAVAGREIVMRATRLAWEQVAGQWREVEKDPQICKQTSTEEAVDCCFDPGVGGTYRVRAIVKDERGRENSSELTLWVAGDDAPPAREIDRQQVRLVPDKKEYAAGERAKLLVMA